MKQAVAIELRLRWKGVKDTGTDDSVLLLAVSRSDVCVGADRVSTGRGNCNLSSFDTSFEPTTAFAKGPIGGLSSVLLMLPLEGDLMDEAAEPAAAELVATLTELLLGRSSDATMCNGDCGTSIIRPPPTMGLCGITRRGAPSSPDRTFGGTAMDAAPPPLAGENESTADGGRLRRDGSVADELAVGVDDTTVLERARLPDAALIVLVKAAAAFDRKRFPALAPSISAEDSIANAGLSHVDATVALPFRSQRRPLDIRLDSPQSLMAELTMARASSMRPAERHVRTVNLITSWYILPKYIFF